MVSCTPSWFWGPVVTLEDCLAAFFAADELKGEWPGCQNESYREGDCIEPKANGPVATVLYRLTLLDSTASL